MKQIKENLKRESFQTFDGLKEDDGIVEIVNKHNVTPVQSSLLKIPQAQTTSPATSDKFISTCQFEIKAPLKKNYLSPNLKLIKVYTHMHLIICL